MVCPLLPGKLKSQRCGCNRPHVPLLVVHSFHRSFVPSFISLLSEATYLIFGNQWGVAFRIVIRIHFVVNTALIRERPGG